MNRNFSTRKAWTTVAMVAIAGTSLTPPSAAAGTSQGGRPLVASLSGADEVSSSTGATGVGDPDGSGTARVTVNPGKNLVCWDISVEDIDTATRGHIHEAAAGSNGPVVVEFFETNGPQRLRGCTTPKPGTTAREILEDPAAYYVNIHNQPFPAGAVRGQLST